MQRRADQQPVGFDGAARLETRGCVYPGLIDLHNHMVYNVLSLWSPPGRTEPYSSRYQWPDERSYEGLISDPANALGALAGKAHLKYVEVKAVIGGVTAIQGSAKMAYPYEGWLVRNVEYETFKTGVKTVYQSALPLRTDADYATNRERMERGAAFLYHVSEGTDPALVAEYRKLRDERCLKPRFCGIHCTALERPNFAEWAPRGGSVIWSPFSNLWLYRATTDVAAAAAKGLRVCLGADWSPSGSKNLLGELKVADLWNRTQLGGEFSRKHPAARPAHPQRRLLQRDQEQPAPRQAARPPARLLQLSQPGVTPGHYGGVLTTAQPRGQTTRERRRRNERCVAVDRRGTSRAGRCNPLHLREIGEGGRRSPTATPRGRGRGPLGDRTLYFASFARPLALRVAPRPRAALPLASAERLPVRFEKAFQDPAGNLVDGPLGRIRDPDFITPVLSRATARWRVANARLAVARAVLVGVSLQRVFPGIGRGSHFWWMPDL